MLRNSTLLHLRIPFSIFLLPVFLFAISQVSGGPWQNVFLVFIVLHLLLYPASNGYNSYFDRDEGSIGGLRKPPPVTKDLYWVSLILDLAAMLLGLIISWQFALMILVYGLVSKAYSHPGIRLKRYPWTGWMVAGFFQGFFTFMMIVLGVLGWGFHHLGQPKLLAAAMLSSILLWGSYPMTQVYQHQEDLERGDITLSLRLGIQGTFHFTAVLFLAATAGFRVYFKTFYNIMQSLIFLGCMMPVVIYFVYWYLKVRNDTSKADFEHTMKLNFISSMSLNACFLSLYFLNH
jgi:1,4-dihydroxy-2-naphthoate octaprenyltransferase